MRIEEMNLIQIYIDTLRYDFAEICNAPNMVNFMKKCVNLHDVYPESLPTIPVRRSMITGKRFYPLKSEDCTYFYAPESFYEQHCPAGWRPVGNYKTIPEKASERGYLTCLITDVAHYFLEGMDFKDKYDEYVFVQGQEKTRIPSDEWKDVDVREYTHKLKNHIEDVNDAKRYVYLNKDKPSFYYVERLFQESESWIEKNKNRDFYLLIDCFDIHQPWIETKYTEKYLNRPYTGNKILFPSSGDIKENLVLKNELEWINAAYRGEVEQFDEYFGKFILYLEDNHILDNTIVFIMSDHGILLGEHDSIGKKTSFMYPEVIKIVSSLYLPDHESIKDGMWYNTDIINSIAYKLGFPTEYEFRNIFEDEPRTHISCAYSPSIFFANQESYQWFAKNGTFIKINRDGF